MKNPEIISCGKVCYTCKHHATEFHKDDVDSIYLFGYCAHFKVATKIIETCPHFEEA